MARAFLLKQPHTMLHFDCDDTEGAHPLILERLVRTNMEQTPGYGLDPYCESARERIRQACGCTDAAVHFLVGGTQTNATVIDGILRPWEGVLAAQTGHINVHEAGAIEAGGHKVITLPQDDGKVSPDDVDRYITAFYADPTYPHMTAPGMLYISYPTEYGTLYTLSELEALSGVCRRHGIPLYIDGARLGYGLAADTADVTLADIARLSDVFYIGGTKVGALFGEAVVVTNPRLLTNFFPVIKQHGALLAKGRLLGIQFDTLFTDGLYLRISRHAVDMAMKLRDGLLRKGYRFFTNSPTNQQLLFLPRSRRAKLDGRATFDTWFPYDDDTDIVRFATSWATREADVDALLELL